MQNRTQTAVRGAYTFTNLMGDIIRQRNTPDAKSQKTSLRKIAKKYGVSHAAIQRVIDGREPKTNAIRHAFGMSEFATVQALPCGHAPMSKRCPACTPAKPRRKYDRTTKELREIGARIYIAI